NVDVPSDTAVYRYVSTENQSFVLVMTERSTHIFQLPSYDVIAETVARFNQAVSDLMQIPDDLQDAIETILPLDPIKNTAIQNIVIIADGALHHLPFASLKADLGEGRLEFLISRYAILYSYSIADYLDNREIPAVETDLSIAAFADPALGDALGQFPRLTKTRDEVDAIKNAFPNADYSIAMDHHANSQFLMSKQTRQSTILHISTHGYYNPAFPDIVGLVTSPSDGSDPTGFLSLSELLGFPVSSKLVVIAGCETTLGKSYKSAGVNSMSRGFVSQGAESVLATLWPIQDKASSLFMVQFYQNLAQSNGDASKALQKTQVQFSQRGRYKQPKYWSGFVLYANNKSSAQIQTSI
ncbi:MAG: CHAT domain-containing protein, partial [Pseudomonadota bacterium]